MDVWIIIDRIENGIAACEIDGCTMKMLPLSLLPPDVKEGDCIRVDEDEYRIDPIETCRRRDYNREMLERIIKRREG